MVYAKYNKEILELHQSDSFYPKNYFTEKEPDHTVKEYNAFRMHALRLRQRFDDLKEQSSKTNLDPEVENLINAKCVKYGIDPSIIDMGWIKDKDTSLRFKRQPDNISLKDINDIVEKFVSRSKVKIKKHKDVSKKALRQIMSDEHVGMNTNPNGDALFAYEYNEEIYKEHLSIAFNHALKIDSKLDTYFLDGLGDQLDGLNGKTTRGGHDLPQNMNNREAFECFINNKLDYIENIIKEDLANNIVIRQVTNDNHAGDFGWMASHTVRMIVERMYPQVEYYNLTKFIEPFYYGVHCNLLTHGKDKSHMKHGLPYILNDKAINFITRYMEHYKIEPSQFKIHLDKGDLHQIGLQKEKRFTYRNFMSFAPPSDWVQTNIGDAYAGFSQQIIHKNKPIVEHTDIEFELKKLI